MVAEVKGYLSSYPQIGITDPDKFSKEVTIGTFTGTESFEGDIEVLNERGEVLLKSKGLFKGWQR